MFKKLRTLLHQKSNKESGAPIRVVFMGTPDFAIPSFRALITLTHSASDRMQNAYKVVAAITQPDRPVGRNRELTSPPIKLFAEKSGIPVFQPEVLCDPLTIKRLEGLKPNLFVVVAYGQIIPKEILDIPQHGTINVHGSLLPKYRGASPIQAAIAAGETETGITIMLMDEKMDHGPVLAKEVLQITSDETGESLFKKLAPLGAELLVKTMPRWISGRVKPTAQDHNAATYCTLLKREDGKLDWSQSAEELEQKIRAYTPWPGTWTLWGDSRLNILSASLLSTSNPVATVIKTDNGFAVGCGAHTLEILSLQPQGKSAMSTADFLRGHPDIIGSTIG